MAERLHSAGMDGGANDETVLWAAQAGAEWAITLLYRELNPPLLRYLRAQERAAAEDLAAEVWLAVATQLAGFEGDLLGLRSWLFTIARRRLIDHRRRTSRRRTAPVPDEELLELVADHDPEQLVTDTLSAQAVISSLTHELSADQADVVLLRVVGGLDAATVGKVMGRSPGWVRITQLRALRRLADSAAPETLVTP